MFVTGTFSPKKAKHTKYSATVKGGYSAKAFKEYKLPTSIVNTLVKASNQSLAMSTWSCYKTAENHLKQCEKDTGVKIRFPMTDGMILAFVGWLISVRKVSARSVDQYLSGLRVAHLKEGVLPRNLRPDIVKSVLRGHEQSNAREILRM